ncbi:hypothetical protein D3C80_2146240 [compost metagenome]
MAPVRTPSTIAATPATVIQLKPRKRVNPWAALPEADNWGQFFMTRSLHEDDGHRRCRTSMSRLMTPA